MKTFRFLFLAFVVYSQLANAQSKSLRFSVGYGLPSGSALLAYESAYSASSTGTTSITKGVYGSLGAGWNFGMSFEKMFSKYAGVDAAVSYLDGATYTSSSSYSFGTGPSSLSAMSGKATGFFFSPVLVIKTGTDNAFQPYVKAGVTLGTVKFVSEESEKTSGSASTIVTTLRTREYAGGLPFGFKAGIGFVANANAKTSFFAEAVFTSVSYYPSKATITAYSVDGQDRMSTLNERTKTTLFKNEVKTVSSSVPPDMSQPSEAVGGSFPLGSFLLNVGIQLKLK